MPLPLVLDAIERLPAFARLLNTIPSPREHRLVTGLPGSGAAAVVATLARRLDHRFFVVVTDSVPEEIGRAHV